MNTRNTKDGAVADQRHAGHKHSLAAEQVIDHSSLSQNEITILAETLGPELADPATFL